MVFALRVACAAFFYRLFEARLPLRVTLGYGTLLALLLGIYGATALLLTRHLTTGSLTAAAIRRCGLHSAAIHSAAF